MKQRNIHIGFILLFLLFGIYSIFNKTQWVIDSSIAIVMIFTIFLLNKYLKLNNLELILIYSAIVIHNLGAFGCYNLYYGRFLAYDNFVHLYASLTGAYIIYNLIIRRFKITQDKAIAVFLAVGAIVLIGLFIEIIEYTGFFFLGDTGQGILYVGATEADIINYMPKQYVDTMEDIIVNIIASFIGSIMAFIRTR